MDFPTMMTRLDTVESSLERVVKFLMKQLKLNQKLEDKMEDVLLNVKDQMRNFYDKLNKENIQSMYAKDFSDLTGLIDKINHSKRHGISEKDDDDDVTLVECLTKDVQQPLEELIEPPNSIKKTNTTWPNETSKLNEPPNSIEKTNTAWPNKILNQAIVSGTMEANRLQNKECELNIQEDNSYHFVDTTTENNDDGPSSQTAFVVLYSPSLSDEDANLTMSKEMYLEYNYYLSAFSKKWASPKAGLRKNIFIQMKKVAGFIRCTGCTRQFNNSRSYGEHINIHTSLSENNSIPCVWNRSLNTLDVLKDISWKIRMLNHDDNSIETQSNSHEDVLDIKEEASNLKSRNVCTECGKGWKTTWDLRRHVLSHSNVKKKGSFECEICSKSYNQLQPLTDHMRLHTKENIFTCKFCGKIFARKQFLDHHLVTHSNQRPYKCAPCGNDYRSPANLRTHTKKHHKDWRIEKLVCLYCKELLLSIVATHEHLIKMHKTKIDNSVSKYKTHTLKK